MNLARTYATILAKSDGTAYDRLVAHLKERGRLKLLPQIARELTTLMARSKATAATLTVASEEERTTAIEQARAEGFEAEEVVIDTTLIRGWRATQKGTLIDRSGKRALTDLYRNITT